MLPAAAGSEAGSNFSIIKAITAGNSKLSAISAALEIKATSLSKYPKMSFIESGHSSKTTVGTRWKTVSKHARTLRQRMKIQELLWKRTISRLLIGVYFSPVYR